MSGQFPFRVSPSGPFGSTVDEPVPVPKGNSSGNILVWNGSNWEASNPPEPPPTLQEIGGFSFSSAALFGPGAQGAISEWREFGVSSLAAVDKIDPLDQWSPASESPMDYGGFVYNGPVQASFQVTMLLSFHETDPVGLTDYRVTIAVGKNGTPVPTLFTYHSPTASTIEEGDLLGRLFIGPPVVGLVTLSPGDSLTMHAMSNAEDGGPILSGIHGAHYIAAVPAVVKV